MAYTYATDIRWDNGTGATPSDSIARYNQASALGAPDNTFLSLGLGGLAVFDFGSKFSAAAIIFETTYGTRENYPESANVYVTDSSFDFSALNSGNGAATLSTTGFTLIGGITNLSESSELDLSTFGGPFRYILVEDTTNGGPSTDGFDVNAVGVAPVPEPATFILLGSGLAGLAFYRRKKK